ncbi:WG repeat-containing protein [Rhizobium leguminosarum]|uniref:WG repeat-containing protein n=1 Tax=Rhizobium leguminosarum TaxID=384 RepID=UPI003F963A13
MRHGKINGKLALLVFISVASSAVSQEMVISPQYDEALHFHEGIAPVRIGESWGFIDRTGKLVMQPTFFAVSQGSDGFFVVNETRFLRAVDRKIYFNSFDNAKSFHNGIAAVRASNGYWGYIRTDGSWMMPSVFKTAGDWHNGCGAVTVNDLTALICDDGQLWYFGEDQPDQVELPNGATSDNGLYVLKVAGKEVFVRRVISHNTSNDPVEDAATNEADEGNAGETIGGGGRHAELEGDALAGLMKENKFDKYTLLKPFSEGWAGASADTGIWTFIDENGKSIGSVFEDIRSFAGGVAAIKTHGKWGFIDKSGRIVLHPTYDAAYSFNENFAVVRMGKKRGFLHISPEGKISEGIKPSFDDVLRFEEGLAPVKINGKWGYFGFSTWKSERSIREIQAN